MNVNVKVSWSRTFKMSCQEKLLPLRLLSVKKIYYFALALGQARWYYYRDFQTETCLAQFRDLTKKFMSSFYAKIKLWRRLKIFHQKQIPLNLDSLDIAAKTLAIPRKKMAERTQHDGKLNMPMNHRIDVASYWACACQRPLTSGT